MSDNTPPTGPVGYRPPAVSIRAAYVLGDATDELTVDLADWNGDVEVVLAIVAEIIDRRAGAHVHITTPDGELPMPGNNRALRTATVEEARA